jgi:hypothetical protein
LRLLDDGLGNESTLKSFITNIYGDFGDELCKAIRKELAKNSTLEELSLYNMIPSDDDGAVSTRNALFFHISSSFESLQYG